VLSSQMTLPKLGDRKILASWSGDHLGSSDCGAAVLGREDPSKSYIFQEFRTEAVSTEPTPLNPKQVWERGVEVLAVQLDLWISALSKHLLCYGRQVYLLASVGR
jgi:hypothetical protein